MHIEPNEPGKYYHIYNRGINGTNLFNESENYQYFLRLYEKFIEPVTETYVWCLLKNHFHLLLRIKGLDEINEELLYQTTNLSGFENPKGLQTEIPENSETKSRSTNFIVTNQFSRFFNTYAKAFNKRYGRTGSLFEKPFERKCVKNIFYFKELVFYIHYNPVNHGFCDRLQDYPWSSYGSVISVKPTKIMREIIIGHFDSIGNFIDYHKQKHDFRELKELLFD